MDGLLVEYWHSTDPQLAAVSNPERPWDALLA